MSTRERHNTDRLVPSVATADPPARGQGELNDGGDAFLVAADAAINRALSGNAQAFLRQNRQLSGQ